jgi:hypothetical protein
MPRLPIDYKKSIIYSIVSKTDETLLYVGSTTDFTKRKNKHKTVCNNENNRAYNFQVYVMIRANGGWEAFDMKPVKEFSCENKIQLLIEEERIRKEMNANLNARKAHLTKEEKQEYQKEHMIEYRQQNKDELLEYQKNYYEQNRDKILKKTKEYQHQNRDEILKKKKEYRQQHKEQIKEQRKEYQQQNKEQIAEYKRQYYLLNRDKILE